MRAWFALLCCLLLSGCAQSAPEDAPQEDVFEDKQGQVDASTGLIRGVVVDETITPVAGVEVLLKATEPQSVETDDEGRFLFEKLAPGTYVLEASKPLYAGVSFNAAVVAGDATPDIVRVQISQLFDAAPSMLPIRHDGYFTCSQNGASVFYSSSPCTTVTPATNFLTDGTAPEERTWHADVPAGWVSQVFEMTWTPSAAATGQHMGLVISTYKPDRDGFHWFANMEGPNPLHGRLDVGELHATAGDVEPRMVPAEGMTDMSFFASVRRDTAAPALAIQQSFEVYVHQFINCIAPDDWSIYAGDEDPCS